MFIRLFRLLQPSIKCGGGNESIAFAILSGIMRCTKLMMHTSKPMAKPKVCGVYKSAYNNTANYVKRTAEK